MTKLGATCVWLLIVVGSFAGCAPDAAESSEENGYLAQAAGGEMIWPVSGRASDQRRAGPSHGGLDIAAPEGFEVRAPFDGTVEIGADETRNVRPDANLKCPPGGRGRFITIHHPAGWQTWYYHLSAQLVGNGATVRKGDPIGRVGNTGCSTGAHLHMEVWRNGRQVFEWDDAAPRDIVAGTPIPFHFDGLGGPPPPPPVAVTDPRVFYWAFYPSVYPDVAAAFPDDFWGMVAHWRDFGVPEGRIGGPGFASTFYLDSYADLRQAFGTDYRAAIGHFLEAGLNEGRTASPVFDPPYYLKRHGDLTQAFGPTGFAAAMTHWVDHGMGEGRVSSPAFDHDYYLDAYADLRQAFGGDTHAARNHYLMAGMHEGRTGSPVFDPKFYLARYEDLTRAFGPQGHVSALIHWMRMGIGECRQASPAFDPQYYLDTYPDLKAAFGNDCVAARDHYLATLQNEGRVGSRVFDPGFYLSRYRDLRDAFGGDARKALHHWVAAGIPEGRQGSAQFDPVYYLASNPDVDAAVGPQNYAGAILHWHNHGRQEGRRGVP